MRNFAIFGLACLVLAGCGVKPGHLEGAGERRTYPDTTVYPAPGGGAPITLPN